VGCFFPTFDSKQLRQAGFFHLRQEENGSCQQIAVISEFKDHAEADDKPNTKRHDPKFELVNKFVTGKQPLPHDQVHKNPQHRGADVQTVF